MKISEKLSLLKSAGRKALTVFSSLGDPDAKTSIEIFSRFEEWGADILELGIPYSDPLMDGPVLQRAYLRSLKNGFKVSMLPHIIENIRKRSDIPMLVMTCYNPVFKYGANRFFRDISAAGASAVLITDLPPEEWGESLEVARSHGLGAIFLVTPTTPIKRMEMINEISEPFVYCVSRAGITGTADELPPEIASYVSFVKEVVTKPLLVGFGISTPEHAKAISRIADGVIIGSAIAAIIEKNLGSEAQMLKALEQFVSGARAAMDA